MILKKNITKVFYVFLFLHLFLWVFVPSISNINLPLDTIEALAWGSNLEWGYNKHPPFSAFVINIFYNIFGSNDWAYYLLSQLCVVVSFLFVWEFSKNFFSNKILSFLSILILEGIVFFNYTTPEFNVYVCQLPLKAALVYFFWRGINNINLKYWIIVGVLSALGILTHYSFIFIILALFFYFIFFYKKNIKIIKYFLISFFTFILILTPHFFWLFDNSFETVNYALNRSNVENKILLDHISNPLVFLGKQVLMLTIFFLLFFSLLSFKNYKKISFKKSNKKILFLLSVNLLPLIFVLFISLITGAKIRTMWMSTFYLFFGVMFFYYFLNLINFKRVKNFIFLAAFFFLLSPITYMYISFNIDTKRTDFPGKEIARLVQNKWDDNFTNEINIVIGDEWAAGNLSYHLKDRPTWFNDLNENLSEIKINQGVIYTGNPKILKKVCPGVFGTIRPYGYCMIGKR